MTASDLLGTQLQTALDSRILLERATGMLAERTGQPMDAAFQLMRTHARGRGERLTTLPLASSTELLSIHEGSVLFLIATFLSWITNQDDESFSGYEADSVIAFTAYLGVGLAVALLIAAQRSERRVQHRGLSLASMATGIAAFGLAVSYLVDTPGAAERGSEWDSELGIYIALVGALI